MRALVKRGGYAVDYSSYLNARAGMRSELRRIRRRCYLRVKENTNTAYVGHYYCMLLGAYHMAIHASWGLAYKLFI